MILFPLVLLLLEIFSYLPNDIYLPAVPDMAKEFGIGNDEANLSLSLWSFK